MTKLYYKTIRVKTDLQGTPISFYWKNKAHKILNSKLVKNDLSFHEWWKEPEPTRYRCLTDSGLTCDIIYDKNVWKMEKVWD